MSLQNKMEHVLQHQRALNRARLKAISELKDMALASQHQSRKPLPLVFNIPSVHPKKNTHLDVLITGRPYRKKTCSERATQSTDGCCQYFSLQNQSLRQQVLALRYNNPFFLKTGNFSWLDVKEKKQPLRKK